MIILKGKYNIAKVMLPNEKIEVEYDNGNGDTYTVERYKYLDDATQSQIQEFLNHPTFNGEPVIIMPDTHYGKGSCVGFTMKLGPYLIPNIIGVDIGCGIMTTNLGKIKVDRELFDAFIRKNIPAGFNLRDKVDETDIDELDLKFVCEELEIDYQKVLHSIGTLGGGNHFIELGVDEFENIWLTIHTGSRNFGLRVANHFQKIANETCSYYFQNFGDLNFVHASDTFYKEYLDFMSVAQHFANMNRRSITRTIMESFFGNVNFIDQIDSVHNYIDFEDNIIRKGATPARKGQKLVIPFNMKDGLIIGEGKGNPDWNYSAPHGAGRILSRNKAKELLDLDVAKAEMESADVYTTSLTENSLDEASGAYKDKQLILDMISDTVEITNFVKPIYNFKDDTKKGRLN